MKIYHGISIANSCSHNLNCCTKIYYQLFQIFQKKKQIKLKTKLRSECERYSSINVPYKYQQIINNRKSNQNITLMKQNKGRCADLLDKRRYRITYQEFQWLYSTSSNAGRFYGARKVHKVPKNDLPIRPIVSNIGAASYHLAKYLAQLLSPLSQSEFTVKSIKHFMSKVKQMKPHYSSDFT